MMKKHRAEVARNLPEWEHRFLSYKKLKRKLKRLKHNPNGRHRERPGPGNPPTQDTLFNWFLNREIDKVNRFYLDKEEDYIIMFREIEIRARDLQGNEEMLELRKEILDFHSEMMMLLHYSAINFKGLMKIVRKHNRQASGSVYLSFKLRVLQQPFLSTELLYNLIRGSEATLERL